MEEKRRVIPADELYYQKLAQVKKKNEWEAKREAIFKESIKNNTVMKSNT